MLAHGALRRQPPPDVRPNMLPVPLVPDTAHQGVARVPRPAAGPLDSQHSAVKRFGGVVRIHIVDAHMVVVRRLDVFGLLRTYLAAVEIVEEGDETAPRGALVVMVYNPEVVGVDSNNEETGAGECAGILEEVFHETIPCHAFDFVFAAVAHTGFHTESLSIVCMGRPAAPSSGRNPWPGAIKKEVATAPAGNSDDHMVIRIVVIARNKSYS